MPAFTHLCSKFNISLAHNALTFYPNKTGAVGLGFAINACQKLYYGMVELHYDLNKLELNKFDTLGRPITVHRNDQGHDLLHNDSFNMNAIHYHLKFPFELKLNTLNKILSICVTFDVITTAEKISFLRAFDQANKLKVLNAPSNSQPILLPPVPARKKEASTQYTEEDDKLLLALQAIQIKANELQSNAEKDPETYSQAAITAKLLHTELNREVKAYLANKNSESYGVFKDKCHLIIEQARPELEKHRGWKNIFCNVGAAIIGLGVFYLVAASINYYQTAGKHFFFQFATDSATKLDNFNNIIPNVVPSA